MSNLKRVLVTIICMIFFIGLFAVNTYAVDYTEIYVKDPSVELYDEYNTLKSSHYDQLPRVDSYKYFASVQPIDALPLTSPSYTLNKPVDVFTDGNTDYTVWSLPMLKDGFYYYLDAVSDPLYVLPDYSYPILALRRQPNTATEAQTLRIMQIKDSGTDTSVADFQLALNTSFVDPVALPTNYYFTDFTVPLAKRLQEDISSGSQTDTWCFQYDAWYYPYMTQFAVFTNSVCIARNDTNFLSLTDSYSDYTEIEDGLNIFKSKAGSPTEASYSVNKYVYNNVYQADTDTVKYNLRHIFKSVADGNGNPLLGSSDYLLYGLSDKTVLSDSNSHSKGVIAYGSISDLIEAGENQYLAVFTGSTCYLYEIKMVEKQLKELFDANIKGTYSTSTLMRVGDRKTTYELTDGWIGATPLDMSYTDNPYYEGDKFTFDDTDFTITLDDQLNYDHMIIGNAPYNGINVNLGYFGFGGTKTYTLKFNTNGGTACTDLVVDTSQVSVTLPTPSKAGYEFNGWYVDENLYTKYDYNTFAYTAGGVYELYAKWTLITGDYTVTYYNDKTYTQTTSTYTTPSDPVLPDNPTYIGHSFKNWLIVESTASTSGTVYDPLTFEPEIGVNYIFKTNWDVTGIITNVTTTQTSYYKGQTIDKGTISVTVQTDSSGSNHICTSDEFTIAPTTMNTTGSQNFTITFKKTGATSTLSLTGMEDTLTGIKSSYSGTSLTVGTSIPTSKIKVTGTYASGKTTTLNSFTISPTTVTAVGTNTITVTASGFTSTVTVTGLANSSGSSSESKTSTLKTITASYTGPTLYVGDTINSSDFLVRAYYSDGTVQTVNSGSYTVSPTKTFRAGVMTVTVGYAGYSANISVNVLNSPENKSGTSTSTRAPMAGPGGSAGTLGSAGSSSSGSMSALGSSSVGSGTTGSQEIIGYDGNGNPIYGRSTNGMNTKTTSTGYLHGNNVYDDFTALNMANVSSSIVGLIPGQITEDIEEVFKNLTGDETSITITLWNGDTNNTIDKDKLTKLAKNNTKMRIEMVDKSSNSIKAIWQFLPTESISTLSDFNPNIEEVKFPRSTSEICVGYTGNNGTIPTYMTMYVSPVNYFSNGQSLSVYRADNKYKNLSYYQSTDFDGKTLSFPNENSQAWVISTVTEDKYPEQWEFSKEYDFLSSKAMSDVNEVEGNIDNMPEVIDSGTQDVLTPITDKQEKETKGNIIIIIVIISFLVVAAGVAAYFILVSGNRGPLSRKRVKGNIADEEIDSNNFNESDFDELQ